jgi:hypothetical protein
VQRPQLVEGQRVPALRFPDSLVQALLHGLVLFRLLPHGFASREFRQHVAPPLGLAPDTLTPGLATYDLRRLRLHGLIARIPKTHRYRVTPFGLRLALFVTRVRVRILRPGLAIVTPVLATDCCGLRRAAFAGWNAQRTRGVRR